MIQKSKVRAHVREKGYRLSADALPALEDAVQIILARAMVYTEDHPRERDPHGHQPGISCPEKGVS